MTVSPIVLVQPEGELWQRIKEEVKEDVNTMDNDLAAIKDWLKKQPHLPDEFEDACLIFFLRGCSYSLEKTKRKIDMYFTMRTACPEFFMNRDITRPELMDLMMNKGRCPTLPGLTSEGWRVVIAKGLRDIEPKHMSDVWKIITMIVDIRLREDVGVAGDVVVLDASIVVPSHLGKLSLPTIQKMIVCLQEAFPVKVKQIHILNTSPLVETVIKIVKPLLKDKMKKRIYCHKDYASLHEYVPKNLLPPEYGGFGASLEEVQEAWIEKLKEYRPWFKAQESIKANEALRPGKPTNYDELFGIEGSFRQLAID